MCCGIWIRNLNRIIVNCFMRRADPARRSFLPEAILPLYLESTPQIRNYPNDHWMQSMQILKGR